MITDSLPEPHRLSDLLSTKLEMPLVEPHIVPRNRLTDRLNAGLARRLTLLVAPTGYGKTTLLAEWLSGILIPDWRIVWVTVDSFDNEPFRLWAYIAAAVKKAYPHLRFTPQTLFVGQSKTPNATALTAFFNAIAQIPYQLVLVLDDYQWITAEAVHQEIGYLIEHQPKNLHLLISTRAVPPIPLARLRAQRQLVEITADDLAFTPLEATSYFSQVMQMDLSPEQVESLHIASEGWIAGLQLAALACRSQSDNPPASDSLLGETHQTFEYLTEEVLALQDPALQEFLLKTSILSELSAPLCDALLERSDSQDLLHRAQQANLFIVPLDEHQHWYRYRRFFAKVLQAHLQNRYPEVVPELHRRASAWMQANGYPEKAISHALAFGDVEQAAKILNACTLPAVTSFDKAQFSQWIGHFSEDQIRQRPQLGVYEALINTLSKQFDEVEPRLRVLEQMLDSPQRNGILTEDERLIRWEIAAIRACLGIFRGNFTQYKPNALALQQNPPQGDAYFHGLLFHALGQGYASRGDLDAAIAAYVKGCRFAVDHGLRMEYCYSQTDLAFIRKMQGHLKDAEHEYYNLIDYATRQKLPSDVFGVAKAGLADIALEQNHLDRAGELVRWVLDHYDKIEMSPPSGMQREWLFAWLAKYSLAIKNIPDALTLFTRAKNSFHIHRENHFSIFLLIDLQVKIWSATGALKDRSLNFEEQIACLDPKGKSRLTTQMARARYLLAQDTPRKTLSITTELIPMLYKAEMRERLIEALILESLAYQATDELQPALQSIQQALVIAALEGYRRMFLEEGDPMKTLLSQYAQSPVDAEKGVQLAAVNYARGLISELNQQVQLPPASAPTIVSRPATGVVQPMAEPLSHREVEILNLLVNGKSTKEIASGLQISINTTKVHIKSIYRKVGAHSRLALRQRAQELGISNKSPRRS